MIEGKLARWLEELFQYNMVIQYRPGKKHTNVDGLFRIPDTLEQCNCYFTGEDVTTLPCDGCPYCRRAQDTWGTIENDVDDVIPLAVRSVTQQSNNIDDAQLDDTELCNWMCVKTTDAVRHEQNQDPDIKRILMWKESDQEPTEHELYVCSPAIKHFWNYKSQLLLK